MQIEIYLYEIIEKWIQDAEEDEEPEAALGEVVGKRGSRTGWASLGEEALSCSTK